MEADNFKSIGPSFLTIEKGTTIFVYIISGKYSVYDVRIMHENDSECTKDHFFFPFPYNYALYENKTVGHSKIWARGL